MASKKTEGQSDMTMKVVIIVALLIAFVAGYFAARAKYKPQLVELSKMVSDKDQSMQKMKANANKIVMKDGKMWIVEDGMVREMDSDIILPNGNKITTDGKLTSEDGTETMMNNGEAMDMDGKMLPTGEAEVETNSGSMGY